MCNDTQLQCIDILASLPALSCRCMGVAKQINLKPSFA